jgi:hypothetical protein
MLIKCRDIDQTGLEHSFFLKFCYIFISLLCRQVLALLKGILDSSAQRKPSSSVSGKDPSILAPTSILMELQQKSSTPSSFGKASTPPIHGTTQPSTPKIGRGAGETDSESLASKGINLAFQVVGEILRCVIICVDFLIQ